MTKDFRATMRERAVGRSLRQWRNQRGFSLAEACQRVGFSTAKLSMMENALQPSDPLDIIALGHACGLSTDLMVAVAREAELTTSERLAQPADSFNAVSDYALVADETTRLRVFSGYPLATILQADEYAYAVMVADAPFRIPEEITLSETVRAKWTSRIHDRHPLLVEVVIAESSIMPIVGGAVVMKAQLLHLVQLAELPNVTVQMVPLQAGAYPATGSTFSVLSFPHRQHSAVVYLEDVIGGRYVEDPHTCELTAKRFTTLQDIALTATQSSEMIAEVASRL